MDNEKKKICISIKSSIQCGLDCMKSAGRWLRTSFTVLKFQHIKVFANSVFYSFHQFCICISESGHFISVVNIAQITVQARVTDPYLFVILFPLPPT